MKRNAVPIVVAAIATALLLVVAAGAVTLVSTAGRDKDRETARADRAQRELDELRTTSDRRKAAEDEVLGTARTNLVAMLTYDYRSLDRYSADVKTRSTQRFYDKFKLTVDLIRGQSAREPTSRAVLRDVALRSLSSVGDEALVLAFVDLAVTTLNSPGSVQRARVTVTFKKIGRDWLVDDLKVI